MCRTLEYVGEGMEIVRIWMDKGNGLGRRRQTKVEGSQWTRINGH